MKVLADEGINVLLEDSRADSNKYFKEKLVDAIKIEDDKSVKRLKNPKQFEVKGLPSKKKTFKCDDCNIEKASKKTLNNHKDKKHKGIMRGLDEKIMR